MQEPYRSIDVSVQGRGFKLRLLRFMNGCFLTVSEGDEERLGALTVSLKIGGRVEVTTITPSRYEEAFSTMLAEMAANMVQGTAVTSIYLVGGLDPDTARGLLIEVKALLKSG